MPTIDPTTEFRRLVNVYSKMTEWELAKLSRNGYELTPEAVEAFRAVVAERHLKIELHMTMPITPPVEIEIERESPNEPSQAAQESGNDEEDPAMEEAGLLEMDERIPIWKYRDLHEAVIAKAALESAGISCFLANENMVRMDWFLSNLFGGIQAWVRPEDADAAREILGRPVQETIELPDGTSVPQPRCPRCGSAEISYREFNKEASLALSALVTEQTWHCDDCLHTWPRSEHLESLELP